MKPGDIVASRYRLEQKLGMGGMGTVWSAQHTQTGRFFALKIMHSTVAANEDSRQRFLKEAKASARIDHPNVIDVLDVGELPEGQLFMAMELLEGLPLVDALRLEPPLSVRELLVVLRETCAALAAAHAVGIVHRDVKPANIFLHRDRASGMIRPKILDFGVSKFSFLEESATHTGSLLGSPRYMSPEQARSAAQADLRSDVWSIGVILFEALTGVYPHEGDSFSNLVVAIATMPPRSIADVAPTVPPALASLVEDCLRTRDLRLPSCEMLAARIDDLLATHDLSQVPCARGKGKKGVARPTDFVVRSTSEMGWTTEAARVRASLSAGVPSPSAPATPLPAASPLFDLPSATTNPIHTVDAPSLSQRTAEVTPPVATRPAFDRARTTPMAPTAHELAGLLARVAQATGPNGTMGLGPSVGSHPGPSLPAPLPPPAPPPRPPASHGGGDETRIHARPHANPFAADPATRLMTLPDPDAATPMLSQSLSLPGVPSPAPSSPYQPVMPSYEARDHLVESVSTFGVERHRPTSMMPGTPPTGDAVASQRRNAGAAIAAASVAVVGLVAALVLVMGRGADEPAAASPAVPAAAGAVPAPVVEEPSKDAAAEPVHEPEPAAPPVASGAVAREPSALPASASSAPAASAPAASAPSAAAAPATSVKLGPPWPSGGPPRPSGPPPGRKKGCASDSIDCLGSGL